MKVSYLAAGLDVNSGWLYLLYVGVAVFVLGQAAFYLVRALKRAKVLNIDKEKIKTAITSSVSFTILPAIGIFIGLVTLVGFWGYLFRQSVSASSARFNTKRLPQAWWPKVWRKAASRSSAKT